jgi:hypothetical protein
MGEGEIGRLEDKETGRRGDKGTQNPEPITKDQRPIAKDQKPLVSGERSDNEKD